MKQELLSKKDLFYDDQNRLKQHYHQVDSNPEELLADNNYNELSQLTNKKNWRKLYKVLIMPTISEDG